MNNTTIAKKKSWESLRRLGERLRRRPARVGLPRTRRSAIVDRLFGDMTHFCFVVELDRKSSRKGSES